MEKNLDDKLDILTKNLDELHNILTSGGDLSRYKLFLLDYKLHLLKEFAQRLAKEKDNERITTRKKSVRKTLLICVGLPILCFILHNLALNLLVMFILNFVGYKDMNKAKKYMGGYNSYGKKLKNGYNRINNYIDMVDEKYNKLQSDMYDEEKDEVKPYGLAEEWIECYLVDEGIKGEDIPLELRDLVIQILKADLEEESDDLEALLHIAQDKVNSQSLKRELGI